MNLTPFPHTIFPTLQNPLFTSLNSPKHTKKLNLQVRNNLIPTTPNPFDSLFPSLNSFALLGLAPVLALALHATRSTKRQRRFHDVCDIGEWILLTSPTPFNRFVTLRCPSLSTGRDCGRIVVRVGEEWGGRIEYQRVCVRAEDGGVVALDWPVSLEIGEERGFDTTVVLVPGSTEGSGDRRVVEFVREAMTKGLFPVVVNPRGCAGSPVVTPRLFTAADSDDVSTAIQFINKARPWTTLMSVGWGYGANMLTKYLAEAGEQTPLTAATCIDNPFDLEEAARSYQYNASVGNKFTSGLVDILRSNKELFQGRARRFDVEKALLAKSLRDFEEVISAVSYEFDTIEDFYSKSSTRTVVGKVQIPVLFIQNNDGRVPLISIPRSLIAENPYTSLLLCSCLPSSVTENDINIMSWSQNLTLEWLTAVELGLLKGRHPVLEDVDVTINPSRGLTLLEGRASQGKEKSIKYLDVTWTNSLNEYSISNVKELIEEDETAVAFSKDEQRKSDLEGEGLQDVNSGKLKQNSTVAGVSSKDEQSKSDLEGEGLQYVDSGKLKQNSTVEAESVKGNDAAVKDGKMGELLQTAQVVMNVLDVTMPGTLTEDDKKKVLTAVGQGESVMKALQDAVPEDVRGKLTSAVSGILQVQGSNINFEGLQQIGKLPKVLSELKSKVQKNTKGISGGESPNHDRHVSDNLDNNLTNNSVNSQGTMEKSPRGSESESGPSEDDTSNLEMTGTKESGNNHESEGFSGEKRGSYSGFSYEELEAASKPNLSKPVVKGEETHGYEYRADQDRRVTQPLTTENQNIQKNERKTSGDQNESTSSNELKDTPPSVGSSPEPEQTESERNDNQKTGNKPLEPASDSSINRHMSASGSKMEETIISAGSFSEPQPTEGEMINNQKRDPQNMLPAQEHNKSTENERNDNQKTENKTLQPAPDSSIDHDKSASGIKMEETTPSAGSYSQPQSTEGESNDNQKMVPQNVQPAQEQNKSGAPDSKPQAFGVSDQLDALVGIDDSTIVAVNSVYGAIESMISQLEKGDNKETQVKEKSDAKKNDSVSTEQHFDDDEKFKENVQNDMNIQSDTLDDPPSYNNSKIKSNSNYDTSGEWIEEPSQNPNSSDWNHTEGLSGNNASNIFSGDTDYSEGQIVGNNLLGDYSDKTKSTNNTPAHLDANQFVEGPKNEYLSRYLLSKMSKTKSLDRDTTTALLLDYLPEEGQWTLMENLGEKGDSAGDVAVQKGVNVEDNMSRKGNDIDKIIEPTYEILDSGKQESFVDHGMDRMPEIKNEKFSGELKFFVKNVILEALKVEAGRRLGVSSEKRMESTLAGDVERVAIAVSWTIGQDIKQNTSEAKGHGVDSNLTKIGSVRAEHIIRAISSAVQTTSSLRRVLPVGVIIGSSLAALRKYFNVTTLNDTEKKEHKVPEKIQEKSLVQSEESNQISVKGPGENLTGLKQESKSKNLNNDNVMIGAVTAAIGASALLAQKQDAYVINPTTESSLSSCKEERDQRMEGEKLEESSSEKNPNDVVSSLAEKAMSVAAPVIPTSDSGGLDLDRLVSLLADLGKRGGMLGLVGKVALLWGGLRGAMSLTDRLIAFFRIADRPLPQRILGFVGMVLVLWSPVVVPLLPAFVHCWTSNASNKIAELTCLFGLYAAVMILIVLWGKRIRGYKKPLVQYGLDLTSKSKIANLLKGLFGGIMLVSVIHAVNVFVGCASLSWLLKNPLSSLNTWARLKFCGKMLMMVVEGIAVACTVALVEELVFRSWLLEEIAADMGYHRGIILSGIGFSLFQRSSQSIPGLLLLSLGLAGVRERSQGSLSIPIGIRAGIIASSFVIRKGGFIVYKHNFPKWVSGTHPFQPFSGVVGVVFALLFALTLYPRQPFHWKKWQRTIRD